MNKTCPKCGRPLPPFDGDPSHEGSRCECGSVDAGMDANAPSSLKADTNDTNNPLRFDYHLKEPGAPSADPPEIVHPLSLLQKHLNTEPEQVKRKRIIAGTIAGGILVSVILFRIVGELFKEYSRQKKEGEKVQQVEWNEEKKRGAEKLFRPATERKDVNESDEERQDELASMH